MNKLIKAVSLIAISCVVSNSFAMQDLKSQTKQKAVHALEDLRTQLKPNMSYMVNFENKFQEQVIKKNEENKALLEYNQKLKEELEKANKLVRRAFQTRQRTVSLLEMQNQLQQEENNYQTLQILKMEQSLKAKDDIKVAETKTQEIQQTQQENEEAYNLRREQLEAEFAGKRTEHFEKVKQIIKDIYRDFTVDQYDTLAVQNITLKAENIELKAQLAAMQNGKKEEK